MTQNQSEEQCLIKYFKYFDMENSGKKLKKNLAQNKNLIKKGFCNLREFIKTIEKIGVVLPKVQDFQLVFDFYDAGKKGKIEYKKMAQDVLGPNALPKRTFAANDQECESMLNKNLVNMLAGKK